MGTLWQDMRFGFRMLLRKPGFTFVVVLVLALGIGANTGIFSIIEQVFLRKLPVKDPDSLVIVVTEGKHVGGSWGAHMLSYPMFKDFDGREDPFSGVLCWRPESATLEDSKGAERVEVELVSSGYFDVLGVSPTLGRTFFPEDETAPGANPVAVLSHDFWQSRFRGESNIVGRTVLINDKAIVVVGVAPREFRGVNPDSRPRIFLPITMKTLISPSWSRWDDRPAQWVRVVARLKAGYSREQAQAVLQTSYRQIIEQETQEAGFEGVPAHEREQFLRSRVVLWPGGKGYSHLATCDSVSRDYCATLGVPLLLGRDFNETDELPGAAKVVIVNETFMRTFFPDRNPLGCRMGFKWRGDAKPDREIVGVVADSKRRLARDEIPPLVLVPYTDLGLAEVSVFVRTRHSSRQIFKAIRSEVRQIDSGLPIYGLTTMKDQLNSSLASERLVGLLSSLFGLLATVLAMVGLYGMTAYSVARRIREIGIRMALGAESRSVLSLILREGMTLAALGIGIRLIVSVGLTRILRGFLFGVTSTDPLTFAASATLLTAVALLASYIPAHRAAKIAPMAALRYE